MTDDNTPLIWMQVSDDVSDEEFRAIHDTVDEHLDDEYDVVIGDERIDLLDSDEVLSELTRLVENDGGSN